MDSTQARIIELDAAGGLACVEVDASVACPRCASGRGCGAALIVGRAAPRRIEAHIAPGVEVAAGDTVLIDIPGSSILAAALLVYGMPLAGAACAASIAFLAGAGDAVTALGALGGAATGFGLGRRRLARTGCLTRLVPTVSSRLAGDRAAT